MTGPRTHEYPHLSNLRLADEDFLALTQQGFVSAEQRGNSTIYKLRFRSPATGRQQVRYIGTDEQVALAVSRELARLQQPVRQRQALRRDATVARRILRESKQRLQPVLEERGLHFHGYEVRSRRRKSATRETAHADAPAKTCAKTVAH